MRRFATTLALLAVCAAPALAANPVRISQVYGGGGGTTAATDFVELFNASGAPVDISGWVVEYGSATGAWNSFAGNAFTFPPGTIIQPCSYLLLAGNVGSGGAPSIGADYAVSPTTVFNMSGTNGKVLLITQLNTNVVCGAEVGTIIDKVSWGTGTCAEGTATPALTAATAAFRNGAGFVDTDNNSADFTVGLSPAPRNSQTPANPTCLVTPTSKSTWGQVKSIYR